MKVTDPQTPREKDVAELVRLLRSMMESVVANSNSPRIEDAIMLYRAEDELATFLLKSVLYE